MGGEKHSWTHHLGLLPVAAFCAVLLMRAPAAPQNSSIEKRRAFLTQLLSMLPPDPHWNEWLHRTGELPPDFDALPTVVDLPDPLVLEEQGKQVRITTREQWARKRSILKEMFQHYVTGRFPPPPDNVRAEVLKETTEGTIAVRHVLLSFGPQQKGKLNLEVLIPRGTGPFPVFMSCSGKRSWVQTGLRRGYIGCIVAAADSADDTEAFAALYPDYDFTCMGRRVWGLSRAIDYLTTLPIVDKAKITFSDHSRGGKLATWAGAFEERLAAVVGSSPVSGGAIPWRYCADRYANETLEMCVRNYPHWFHPRLRFFVGRENKLPFDMHEMLALTAPRGYMLTLGINEGEVNAWGEERGFLAARRVYEFLGAKDRIALRFRPGIHPTYASDIEDYFDWYDTVLGRRTVAPSADKLLYDYSFEKWKSLSGENPDIRSYPERAGASALGRDTDWNRKRDELRKRIIESLGESPGRAQAQAPRRALPSSPPGVAPGGGYADQILNRPRPTAEIDRASLSFGNENVTGSLYYRREVAPHIRMPVVIWLHPYTYSTGYSRLPILPQGSSVYATGMYSFEAQGYLGTDFKTNSLLREGFAIFTYDMIGFGSRIPEARRFYERFPHWSLMGRMVDDVRSAVELLSGIERIDPRQIYVMGYSLGGTVGLLAAALDDRIAGAISFCGFTPLRLETAQKGTGSLDNYAFIHGLIPRLGFFKGAEKHLPWDFDEVLALIAPRPLMIVAPRFDQEATFEDVRHSVEQARRVYEFLKPGEQSAQAYDYRWSGIWRLGGARNVRLRNLELYAPPDYNHFSNAMQSVVYHWMRLKLLGESR